MKKLVLAVLLTMVAAGALRAQEFGKPDTPPTVVSSVPPVYTKEAETAKVEGEVLISLVVDVYGNPTNARVMRGLGHGLDEKALEAVRAYKFKPAMKDGFAVPTGMYVKVSFKLIPDAAAAAHLPG